MKERVSEAIEKIEPDFINKDPMRKHIEFTQKMKKLGILNSYQQEPARMTEGGLDQLKLYSISKYRS